jgi:dTDP-4-dehydrorhamnose 3,5-epimerase
VFNKFWFISQYNWRMDEAWVPQSIPGLYTVGKPLFTDSRGSFHKILCEPPAGHTSLPALHFDEIYWSSSGEGVSRGMHVQAPPFHGRKLVFTATGTVTDFVIDLRIGSPTFQEVWSTVLSPASAGVLIPAGCAHGFSVQSGPAVLVYAQEGFYSSEFDTGVNMDSIGVELNLARENMSERDFGLPRLTEFQSTFSFDKSEYPNWETRS